MKKALIMFLGVFLIFGTCYADEAPTVSIPSKASLNQGFLIKWTDPAGGVKNLTTITIAETKPFESGGVWNVLWDGWSIDGGWSYDSNSSMAALMVGRHFGTLGKYLPIAYPFADKINVNLYPIGIIVDDPFGHPSVHGASGLGIIKLDISF